MCVNHHLFLFLQFNPNCKRMYLAFGIYDRTICLLENGCYRVIWVYVSVFMYMCATGGRVCLPQDNLISIASQNKAHFLGIVWLQLSINLVTFFFKTEKQFCFRDFFHHRVDHIFDWKHKIYQVFTKQYAYWI